MKYNTDSKEKIMNENESLTVTLTLENNEELECAVLNIFKADEKSKATQQTGKRITGIIIIGSSIPNDLLY